MSLIESFSKPRWQHQKPEVREAAIAELTDQDLLEQVVRSDPEPALQALALSRINQPESLDRLIDRLEGDLLGQARSMRLQQLLPSPERLESVDDDDLLVRIADLAGDDDLRRQALSKVTDPQRLIDVIATHSQAAMRLAAVSQITDLELLRQILQSSGGRDKAVYRYCKTRLDRHQAEQRAEEELRDRLAALVDKAAQLEKTLDPTEFKGRFLTIRQHWSELHEHADAGQKAAVEKALKLGEARQQAAREEVRREEDERARKRAAEQVFVDRLQQLEALDKTGLEDADEAFIENINAQLNEIEEDWVSALRLATASEAQNDRCKTLLAEWRRILLTEQRLLAASDRLPDFEEKPDHQDFESLQKQLAHTEKLIRDFVWPEHHEQIMPEPIRQLHEQRDAIQQRLATLEKAEKQNTELLEESFNKLQEELKTNHYDNADREHRRLRSFMRRLPPARQRKFQQKLRPLTARLHEIHDWQGFAIEPKKLDLIEQMKALGSTADDPDTLAGRIKSLQSQWKQLGHLAPHRDQELWKEFKAAADVAFEPCKQAFAERAEVHRENVRRRMAVIDQLIEYERKMHWPDTEDSGEDHPAPDWKLVQKTLDTARRTIRDIKPVDRKGERKTQRRLKKVGDRIYGHIRAEYERNIQLKNQLIEEASTLTDTDDIHQAISTAKRLQREWKEVGITPIRVDRKLWKKFRGACDAVFARLDDEKKQASQEIESRISEARAFVTEARELVTSAEADQQARLTRDLGELKSAMRNIEIPSRVRQQLLKQFSELEAEARDRASAWRREQEQARWMHLVTNMKACALKNESGESAGSDWNEEATLPKGIDSERLADYRASGPDERTEEACREACIALEVLLERESPDEDREARMAYQMKRLVEGMGGPAAADPSEQLVEHVNRFVQLRPALPWVERFTETLASQTSH